MSAGSSYAYQSAPTPAMVDASSQVSGSTVAVIFACAVVGFLLLYWVSQFALLYFYYKNDATDRPNSIYDSNENNCNDMCCIYTNKSIIRWLCPDVLTKAGDASLYVQVPKAQNAIAVVTQNTTSRQWLPYQMSLKCIPEGDDEQVDMVMSPHSARSDARFSSFV